MFQSVSLNSVQTTAGKPSSKTDEYASWQKCVHLKNDNAKLKTENKKLKNDYGTLQKGYDQLKKNSLDSRELSSFLKCSKQKNTKQDILNCCKSEFSTPKGQTICMNGSESEMIYSLSDYANDNLTSSFNPRELSSFLKCSKQKNTQKDIEKCCESNFSTNYGQSICLNGSESEMIYSLSDYANDYCNTYKQAYEDAKSRYEGIRKPP